MLSSRARSLRNVAALAWLRTPTRSLRSRVPGNPQTSRSGEHHHRTSLQRVAFPASLFLLVTTLGTGCAHLPKADHGLELRVLVYNIHAGADATGVNNIERVAAIVRETK